MRLAEEYDAAQERGEVRRQADNQHVADPNKLSSSDLGLRRDEIHEARRLRDAERADPGVIQRTVDGMVERGEEPTRAALRRKAIERLNRSHALDHRSSDIPVCSSIFLRIRPRAKADRMSRLNPPTISTPAFV